MVKKLTLFVFSVLLMTPPCTASMGDKLAQAALDRTSCSVRGCLESI